MRSGYSRIFRIFAPAQTEVMKKKIKICLTFLFALSAGLHAADSWIRINQAGYLPQGPKRAVLISESVLNIETFQLFDVLTNEKCAEFRAVPFNGSYPPFRSAFIFDFSEFKHAGAFYIKAGTVYSPTISINKNAYLGAADFLLNYMRLQRCGNNPELETPCHIHDGFIVPDEVPAQGGLPKTVQKIDLSGGWHHGSEHIKYGSTTAVSVYQMLLAYQNYPSAFADYFNAAGEPRPNGIPDILDEAKWGLEWLMKTYPNENTLFHQIGDDRGNSGLLLPNEDMTDYGPGAGRERPAYKATGNPQGLFGRKNQSDGIASIAGKYASAFALGAELLWKYDSDFCEKLEKKAVEAYRLGKKNPGVTQGVPAYAPYYLQEENWTDDMELAAVHLFRQTFEYQYVFDAAEYGRMEPVSPWICTDTTKRHQWYPFVNTGHYMLGRLETQRYKNEFTENIRMGLERAMQKAKESPFLVNIPFIQGSNNLAVALAVQCRFYRELTGDKTYSVLENALTDWMLGLNPWGISMIVGLPRDEISPQHAYSSLLSKKRIQPNGGVVAGPVYEMLYAAAPGLNPPKSTEEHPQPRGVVYQDDHRDYLTNDLSIDRTSSMAYLLAGKQAEGTPNKASDKNTYLHGGITRTNAEKKQITLAFYGYYYADGYKTIRRVLQKRNIKASFFFTGDFYRADENRKIIKTLKKEGHYLGAHSDKNLQYCAWDNRNKLLVSRGKFKTDLQYNFKAMERFGIKKEDAPFFLPPFQWYNKDISNWTEELGLKLVNFTQGTYTNADHTVPEMRGQYYSSQEIYNKIMQIEEQDGLNGYILLFSFGSDRRRTDKFYYQLEQLITELQYAGYKFVDLFEAADVF